MSERFYLESPQITPTPALRRFANDIVPSVATTRDLNRIFYDVNDRLVFLDHSALSNTRSINEVVNQRLSEASDTDHFHEARAAVGARRFLHASFGGIRSAEEILADRFVSAQYPCTDRHVLIKAVLRCHGVPCRLVRAINTAQGQQTSLIELSLNPRNYVLKNIPGRRSAVSPGLVKAGYPLPWITDFWRGPDHWASNLDVRNLLVHAQDPTLSNEQARLRSLHQ